MCYIRHRSVVELISDGDKKKILEHYTRTYHARPGVAEVLTVNFVAKDISSPTDLFWPSQTEIEDFVNGFNSTESEKKRRAVPEREKCQLHQVNLKHQSNADSVWYCGKHQPPVQLRQSSPASSCASLSTVGPSVSRAGSPGDHFSITQTLSL